MHVSLRALDPELRDLARTAPPLVDVSGRPTGLTLVKWLGTGGMATVFLAELDGAARSPELSPLAPRRLAIKLLLPAMLHQAERMNVAGSDLFMRETAALGRMMERQPPCEFVVGYYGSGRANVDVDGRALVLPWLAIELIDGGAHGVTLTERVARAGGEGIDAVRALRLLRGMLEGVATLHGEDILHRDLKPDNVLIAGPVDDETPKLADCGIARIDGIAGTVAAMTPEYGGPEQLLSKPWERNPLIGPWTDVHALAAVVWFLLGGENWCRGDGDSDWHRGRRRSLLTAPHVHASFLLDQRLLDRIDLVLARAASQRLPAAAFARPAAARYEEEARRLFPLMFTGPERFATMGELAGALLPLFEQCAALWQQRCSVQSRASTAFRSTEVASGRGESEPLGTIREIERSGEMAAQGGFKSGDRVAAEPGSAVFQPDGKMLVRFGDQLLYFVGDRPHKVAVPPSFREMVAASKWLARGSAGGFALIGPAHVLSIRGNRFVTMTLPGRPSGGEVGEIQAVVGAGGVFGVITAETDDSNGGPEMWTSPDGVGWAPPVVLPLGGAAHAVSHGPYGFLVVGSQRNARARALFLPFDNHAVVYMAGVNERPPLRAALCGASREAWGAGSGFVLSFQRGAVTPEEVAVNETPAAMALDLVGVPWLVTHRSVLRRHVTGGVARWLTYYRRDETRAPLVGIGFTPEGALVLDAEGNAVSICPRDPSP
jgi:hypothetical protein